MALLLGGSLPLHVGAAPCALLAFEPRGFWEHYVSRGPLEAFTANPD
jgi:DNA-binding IclR family transcriptional regulator